MTTIPPAATTPSRYTNTTTATGTTGNGDLGQDAFLSLLVAQLRYQDPSNPMDSSQFMVQTAQFTMVEKITALATAQSDLLTSSHLQSATSMVGRSISWSAADGSTKTGAVTAVSVVNGAPTLLVGTEEVALSAVTRVEAGTT